MPSNHRSVRPGSASSGAPRSGTPAALPRPAAAVGCCRCGGAPGRRRAGRQLSGMVVLAASAANARGCSAAVVAGSATSQCCRQGRSLRSSLTSLTAATVRPGVGARTTSSMVSARTCRAAQGLFRSGGQGPPAPMPPRSQSAASQIVAAQLRPGCRTTPQRAARRRPVSTGPPSRPSVASSPGRAVASRGRPFDAIGPDLCEESD